MVYSIGLNGNIALETTHEEAKILFEAVTSKNLLLRRHPEEPNKAKCNQLLAMQVLICDAMEESERQKRINRLLMSEKKTATGKFMPEPDGFWKSVRDFFDPPFNTSDFDDAIIPGGEMFFITGLDFKDASYPYNASGLVIYEGKEMEAFWNSRGKCRCEKMGTKASLFNLIRPGWSKTSSAKSITWYGMILVAAFVIYILIS